MKTDLSPEVIWDKRYWDKLNSLTDDETFKGKTFLRPNGTIYGFVDKNNVIYLNPDALNLNTPIHEFGHI